MHDKYFWYTRLNGTLNEKTNCWKLWDICASETTSERFIIAQPSPVRTFLPWQLFSHPTTQMRHFDTTIVDEGIWISRSVSRLHFDSCNLCFTNNKGLFTETKKKTIKGAKMCGIINPKLQPKVWYLARAVGDRINGVPLYLKCLWSKIQYETTLLLPWQQFGFPVYSMRDSLSQFLW